MIVEIGYAEILANLSRNKPIDLDQVVFDQKKSAALNPLVSSGVPVPGTLWKLREDGHSFIGLRIKKPVAEPETLAAKLCSIALERQVHPVFLSYISQKVMQHYGFRVEQLSGLPPEAQQQFEQQLVSFWGLALVIDVSEIENLG